MTSESNIQGIDLSGRLRDLQQLTGTLAARRQGDAEVIPISEAPRTRLPVPRRARVFLRHGGGHGTFADLTLTAPVPRRALD